MTDTRALRKLVKTIESEGGWFRRQDERPFLMDIDLPTTLSHHETAIRENYDAIFGMLFPQARSSRKKRFTCAICASGHGCRRRQAIKDYQLCPACQHWCASHFLPDSQSSGGCLKWIGPDLTKARCKCPGWPQAAAERKKIPTRENDMSLFTPEELAESHAKFLEKQAELDAERPKSKAEILIGIVSKDPSYTARELSEGSGMSLTWVRRTLKSAGLQAAPARRQRHSGAGEEKQ